MAILMGNPIQLLIINLNFNFYGNRVNLFLSGFLLFVSQ
jgi:hypothetical protein